MYYNHLHITELARCRMFRLQTSSSIRHHSGSAHRYVISHLLDLEGLESDVLTVLYNFVVVVTFQSVIRVKNV